jgi:hypothetical protein
MSTYDEPYEPAERPSPDELLPVPPIDPERQYALPDPLVEEPY